MLIEFSVANFRSICRGQVFSLAKAKGGERSETNTFSTPAPSTMDLLRSAAIYGPNASGKTTFLQAIRAVREIVTESASLQRGEELPVTPFRLSQDTLSAPSEFEVTFIAEGVRYQYGFTATSERIHEEWLFAFPQGKAQRWFQRAWDSKVQEYQWEMGSKLTGEKQLWQRSTRDNALFLSTAVQLNSQQLQPLYDWFNKTLRVVNLGGLNPGYSATYCHENDKDRILQFLRAADLNIDDVVVEKDEFDPMHLPSDMPDHVKDMIVKEMSGKTVIDVKTVHKTREGGKMVFDLDDESDGTKKLFSFAGPWLDTLANGRVLFIDELHDNLHPKLVQFLVELFHNNDTNPKNAQLVFTTHETSILSQEVFRRDQIWFCERNEHSETSLVPLTDFSPRKGRENLELAYLSGRYGALPFVGEFRISH